MTEAEWLSSAHRSALLEYMIGIGSTRKFRLLACAACRRIWHLLPDQRSTHAIEIAEQFADGHASLNLMMDAQMGAMNARDDCIRAHRDTKDADRAVYEGTFAAYEATYIDASTIGSKFACNNVVHVCAWAGSAGFPKPSKINSPETTAQCDLIRDIFGNPFRPVTLDPRWQSSTVRDLARTIYDQRTFETLPILGDALMDAGCDNDEMIQHCQGSGTHVRGCWVVDLILGKK